MTDKEQYILDLFEQLDNGECMKARGENFIAFNLEYLNNNFEEEISELKKELDL